VFSHQHEGEIKQSLDTCANTTFGALNFVPVRGNFTRGIFASIYFKSSLTKEECKALLKEQYATSPFVFIADETVHLKQVVNTNCALIHPHVSAEKVHLTICIDNLIKGASGQAVQNMNVALGIPQTTGLFFKPNYF
jgi:N-acetyl-gamma-glutamyl-phosphate reductase